MSAVRLLDFACDRCGQPAGVALESRWEWRRLAPSLGWNATAKSHDDAVHDLCPRCAPRCLADARRAFDADYWGWRLAEGAPLTGTEHAPDWVRKSAPCTS